MWGIGIEDPFPTPPNIKLGPSKTIPWVQGLEVIFLLAKEAEKYICLF